MNNFWENNQDGSNMKKSTNLLAATLFALLWTACSDSSSGSEDNPQTPGTGNEEVLSSASPEEDVQSSASEEPQSSSEEKPTPVELAYDSVGFVDIAEAYRTVAQDEKVVFVLRHAERKAKLSKETPLTNNGVQQAPLSLATRITFVQRKRPII